MRCKPGRRKRGGLTTESEKCGPGLHLSILAFFELGDAFGAPEVTSGDDRRGLRIVLSQLVVNWAGLESGLTPFS